MFFVNLYSPWLYYWSYAGIVMRLAANALEPQAYAPARASLRRRRGVPSVCAIRTAGPPHPERQGRHVSSLLPRIKNALSKRARRVSKHVYQSIRWRTLDRPKVLMIVGCQRSGTTLMSRLFDADRDCRVFGEFSALSSVGKDGIRLNPLPDVAAVLSRVPAPLVVMKPLVETQRVRTLLNYFPNAKALFMYRALCRRRQLGPAQVRSAQRHRQHPADRRGRHAQLALGRCHAGVCASIARITSPRA